MKKGVFVKITGGFLLRLRAVQVTTIYLRIAVKI